MRESDVRLGTHVRYDDREWEVDSIGGESDTAMEIEANVGIRWSCIIWPCDHCGAPVTITDPTAIEPWEENND